MTTERFNYRSFIIEYGVYEDNYYWGTVIAPDEGAVVFSVEKVTSKDDCANACVDWVNVVVTNVTNYIKDSMQFGI